MSETLQTAAQKYLEHLKSEGKKEATLYTYGRDFEQIQAFFGPERKLTDIRSQQVGRFFKSDTLLKLPSGKKRAQPTVDKTMRVLRMFLVWAKETGRIKTIPLPKDAPMGRRAKKQEE